MRRTLFLFVLIAILVPLGLAGPALAYPPEPPPVTESEQQLAGLTVAPPGPMDGYSRDRFPTWADKGDNCNAREFALKREGTDVEVGNDCYPTSGRWFSVYDEVWVDQPREASIDHMVPLANAWRSGASEWTDDEREVFANDTERGQLIAVTASSNSSKGDQDPSEWRPTNAEVWCDYSRWWIDVKYDYQLTITDPEKSALGEMLQSCA
ncbi:MAG: HNH endonuclease family protein [Micromonosporaceae bacterium]